MKCLITEPDLYSDKLLQNAPANWEFKKRSFFSNSEFSAHLKENKYQVIFSKIGLDLSSDIIKLQPSLRIIVSPTTGLDHIDLSEASKKNIRIISLKGETKFLKTISSTAEHAWALLLALNKNLINYINLSKKNEWSRSDYQIYQLRGKTIGIIGMGRLGRIVAKYAQAFNLNIVTYDKKELKLPKYIDFVPINNLLKISDYVIILANYNVGDSPIINKKNIELLKDKAIIVNVARGELVDEEAIINAMENERIFGYGTDVLNEDSKWDQGTKISSRMIEKSKSIGNLLITPHIGGYSHEAIKISREFVFWKTLKQLNGSI